MFDIISTDVRWMLNKSSTDFRYWAGWANPQLPRKLLGATSRPLRSLLAASPQPSQPPQNFLAMSHRPFVFAFLKYMRAFASPPLATRYTTLPRVNGKPPFGGLPTPHDVVSFRTPSPKTNSIQCPSSPAPAPPPTAKARAATPPAAASPTFPPPHAASWVAPELLPERDLA